MGYHAVLSPSSAHRWIRCAGAPALEQGLTDDSKYADEGTAAHELGKWCLQFGCGAAAYMGRIIKVEDSGREFTVDEDFAREVQKYVDRVREYLNGAGEGAELLVEQALPIGQITGEKDATGTGDAVILDYAAKEIQVHDLKFGKGVRVDAEENEQEMLYALGALHNYELLGDWQMVRLVIHQPRLEHLSEWSCTIEELQAFAKRAAERAKHATIVLKTGVTDSDLVPGEKQCRFCKAKSTCPALAKTVAEEVFGDFEALDQPKGVGEVTTIAAAMDAKDAPNELLGRYLAKVELIEEWCRAVKAMGEMELLAGNPVPGWKLVQGRRGNRAWIDPLAVEVLFKSFRLKREEMYEHNLISPTTAEKLLKDQEKRWPKVVALITQADGKPSVAPESDKRPALVITPAADDFQNLEQELV